MRPTQKHFVYGGLAAIGVVSVLILYIGYVGWSPINREAAGRIQRGMTLKQVEQILGGPCTVQVMTLIEKLQEPAPRLGALRSWQDSRAFCTVVFDTDDRVAHVSFHEMPSDGVIGRIQSLFNP